MVQGGGHLRKWLSGAVSGRNAIARAGLVGAGMLLASASVVTPAYGQVTSSGAARDAAASVKSASVNDSHALPSDLLFLKAGPAEAAEAARFTSFSRKVGTLIFDMDTDNAFPGHDAMATADLVFSLHRKF